MATTTQDCRITIRLPRRVRKDLKALAKGADRKEADYVRRILKQHASDAKTPTDEQSAAAVTEHAGTA